MPGEHLVHGAHDDVVEMQDAADDGLAAAVNVRPFATPGRHAATDPIQFPILQGCFVQCFHVPTAAFTV